jgi:hypothetical protein
MSVHLDRIDRSCQAAGSRGAQLCFRSAAARLVNAARAVIPIEDVEDHDLEWLEKWIAETETVP